MISTFACMGVIIMGLALLLVFPSTAPVVLGTLPLIIILAIVWGVIDYQQRSR